MPPRGLPLGGLLLYSILSRAVLSQSTQPTKPIGFHTPRAADPLSKSYNASLSSSLHLWAYLLSGMCQVLYFTEKILDENLVVFRGSFPSPIDLAPSIRTSKVCAVSFPYLICIAGLALSDLIGLTRLSWVSLLA